MITNRDRFLLQQGFIHGYINSGKYPDSVLQVRFADSSAQVYFDEKIEDTDITIGEFLVQRADKMVVQEKEE